MTTGNTKKQYNVRSVLFTVPCLVVSTTFTRITLTINDEYDPIGKVILKGLDSLFRSILEKTHIS